MKIATLAMLLSRRQSITLGIETAVQNATLALVIASTVLRQDAMAIPGAYGVLMYAGALVFAYSIRRYATDEGAEARAPGAAARGAQAAQR
ncbi:MAG: bile acid:sodium symporter family protein [Massilia sp.]|nr:bile acid:sodium symporter family protein [Massilia sp.]